MYFYLFAFLALFHIWRQIQWKFLCKPDFSGKVVLITGGSSGIGEELCKQCIRYNASKVVIAARNMTELERVKQESGDPTRVDIVQIDLSKPREVLAKLQSYFKDNK